ncbi:hypothetical protein [Bartonella sp. ML69XJBT]|uniref:hypothetical protein n=1 Tax=Bartonella sp. ML69XJBT TaxID=3019092 RepID=UPI002361E905|nr:hypothetical protein [Bartonella sp. ML69XJBT]
MTIPKGQHILINWQADIGAMILENLREQQVLMRRKEISQLSTCQKRQKAHSTGIHQYPQAAINFYHKLLAPASTNTPPAHNTSLTSPQIPPPTPPLVTQTTFSKRAQPHHPPITRALSTPCAVNLQSLLPHPTFLKRTGKAV